MDKTTIILHGTMALVGGLAKALSNESYKPIRFITDIVVCGFTGAVAAMLAIHFIGSDSPYITGAITGSFSFAGKEGMDFIFGVVKKSFQANIK
jgi:hypothetical protein